MHASSEDGYLVRCPLFSVKGQSCSSGQVARLANPEIAYRTKGYNPDAVGTGTYSISP
jgi:hypothetical protein